MLQFHLYNNILRKSEETCGDHYQAEEANHSL